MKTLPKHLLMNIEGFTHWELNELITETFHTDLTKTEYVTTAVHEHFGYKPFLIDLLVWPLDNSKSYMAHKRFGHYELFQIDDKPVIEQSLYSRPKPYNWDSRYCIPWVGVYIHLPLKLEDTAKSIRIDFKDVSPKGIEVSQGVYRKDVRIDEKGVWFDLLIPGRNQ